jgi:hypothetical protein
MSAEALKEIDAATKRFVKLTIRKRSHTSISNISNKLTKLSLTDRRHGRKPLLAVGRNDRVCRICYNNLGRNDYIQLPCRHFYHYVCITKWFKVAKASFCPTCKQSVGQSDQLKRELKSLICKASHKLQLHFDDGWISSSELERVLGWFESNAINWDRSYESVRILAKDRKALDEALKSINGCFKNE